MAALNGGSSLGFSEVDAMSLPRVQVDKAEQDKQSAIIRAQGEVRSSCCCLLLLLLS